MAEMVAEATKWRQATIERLVTSIGVCQDCRVAPIEVIDRPPTFEVEILDDADRVLRSIGLPLSNPYSQYHQGQALKITEVLRMLCLECSRRRAGL